MPRVLALSSDDFLDLLAARYEFGAKGPDLYDCWGLVCEVRRRLGLTTPDKAGLIQSVLSGQAVWTRSERPRAGMVVAFNTPVPHVGVMISRYKFIHIEPKVGVAVEQINMPPWATKVAGFWEYKPLANSQQPTANSHKQTVYYPNPFDPTAAYPIDRPDVPCSLASIACRREGLVVAAVDGTIVERERWETTIVGTDQSVAIVADVAGPTDMIRMAAMLALAVAAPYVASGVTLGAVMIGGALLINAAIPVKAPKTGDTTGFQFGSQTIQQEGTPIPVTYGKTKVYGNVIAWWTSETNTTSTTVDFAKSIMVAVDSLKSLFGIKTPFQLTAGEDLFITTDSQQKLTMLIDLGEGPCKGIVAGSMRINGRPTTDFEGVTITTTKGTLDQAALVNCCKIERQPMLKVTETDGAVTWQTPYAVMDDLEIALAWPRGAYTFAADGDWQTARVIYRVEIAVAGSGMWHTLVEDSLFARTGKPLWQTFLASGTYTGGSAYTVVSGTQYDIRVTRLSTDLSSTGGMDDMHLGSVRMVDSTAFTYPGHTLVLIEGFATKEFNGTIEFECELEGKICEIYDPDTGLWSLDWSDDPATVAWNVLTGPLITGNGVGVPFAVHSYRGVSSAKRTQMLTRINDWAIWSEFCAELVDDGAGGTEKRFTYNGTLADRSDRWTQAVFIAGLGQAALVPMGMAVGVVVDAVATPCYMATVSTIGRDSYRDEPIPIEGKADRVVVTYKDRASGYQNQRRRFDAAEVAGSADSRLPHRPTATIDVTGLVKSTEVNRYGTQVILKNTHLKRQYQWVADVESWPLWIYDVLYLQHDVWDWSDGPRVLEAYDRTIILDRTPDSGHTFNTILVKQTVAGVEVVRSYTISSVVDNIVVVTADITDLPVLNDLAILGPTAVATKLVRIMNYSRSDDGGIQIEAIDYDARCNAITLTATDGQQGLAEGSTAPRFYLPSIDERVHEMVTPGTRDTTNLAKLSHGRFLSSADCGAGEIGWQDVVVIYQGTLYTITDNTAGTTDLFVYWDPSSPTVFTSTDDASDLTGMQYMAYNDSGTPYSPFGSQEKVSGQTVTDLSIQTPQVADETVFNGGTAVLASPVAIGTSYTDILSLVISSDGAPVIPSGGLWCKNTAGYSVDVDVYIYNATSSSIITTPVKITVPAGETKLINLSLVTDLPTSGSITYKIRAQAFVISTCTAEAGTSLMVQQWKGK